MNGGSPAVHPQPDPYVGVIEIPRMRWNSVQGLPATAGGLCLRLCQFAFAAVSLSVMASTDNFPSITAFVYLVAAMGLQSLWSLSMAVVDVYALLVRRRFRKDLIILLFGIGDGITSVLSFAAASASAGVTLCFSNDLHSCAEHPCTRFEAATAMAFISWFVVTTSFFLNYWSLFDH